MAKKFACAITHVRHEQFFLDKWIQHYGAIVGRENLRSCIDGADWEPQVDLSGIQVEVVEDAPHRRIRNDKWAANHMSGMANNLRKYEYHNVMRTDVDEFIVRMKMMNRIDEFVV